MKSKDKNLLYVIVGVLVVASVAFRMLNNYKLEQTTLLFVGIPTLITLLLIKYSKTPKSIYGVVFKTITLFLLMSAILFGEGLVCIIFMAPIFYGTAAIIVWIISQFKNNSRLNMFVFIPLFLLYSQLHNVNSNPEIQTIKNSVVLSGNHKIEKLNQMPDFIKGLPSFFKIGFPKPISIEGNGLEVGDSRKILFESNTKGIGTLNLKIKERSDETVVFEVVNDDTHLHHWLSWKEVTVKTKLNKNNTTQVTWETKFTCDLEPIWYFEPLEKYGVKLMNEHLINSYFNGN